MDNTLLNTAYLQFDAFSIRDAIIRKLSEDANFTDQIYTGSNLSVIIDLVSVMFQSLMYNLNASASESMFSDTVIYENINRLVKFLGYNPRGYITSQVQADVSVPIGYGNTVLYPFAYIDTGLKDSLGKSIYFSTAQEYYLHDNLNASGEKLNAQPVTLYNGKWKLYNEILIGKGSAYETFVLPRLVSDHDLNLYIGYPHVVVYVKRSSAEGIQWIKYSRVENIFANGSTIYSASDNIFELRLNENKQFEITFGNGLSGSRLQANDELYIFYLESNGPDGAIDAGALGNRPFNLNPSAIGINREIFIGIFGENSLDMVTNYSAIRANNIVASSIPTNEETVNQIRQNAPAQFITAGRLVTEADISAWIKRTYISSIHDVKTMNNWKYITEFYGWLYNIGMQRYQNGSKYISPSILQKYGLSFTDAADSNAIYIWTKTHANSAIPENIITDMDAIKPLTANIILIPPLHVKFALCIAEPDYVKQTYLTESTFDINNENYLEITVEDDLRYSPVLIKNSINQTIKSYFSENNFTLGQLVDINKLYDTLMDIPGIIRIRTVFAKKDALGNIINPSDYIAKTGLCFATWTSDVITPGDDLEISSIQRKLESFQFPTLAVADWSDKIKVITKNSNFSTIIS